VRENKIWARKGVRQRSNRCKI